MTIAYSVFALSLVGLGFKTLSSKGFEKFKYFCIFMAVGLLGAAIIQIMHME